MSKTELVAEQIAVAPVGGCAPAENLENHPARMQAHADYLVEHQRRSGIRARRCSTGCYSLYGKDGRHLGRTVPPGTHIGAEASTLRTIAHRMALSEEMLTVCRLVDAEVEATGAVTGATVDLARAVLRAVEAA